MDAAPQKDWRCDECAEASDLDEEEQKRKDGHLARQRKIGELQRQQARAKRAALVRQEKHIANFVSAPKLENLRREHERDRKSARARPETKDASDEPLPACDTTQPSYTTATLRDYQVDGINWMVTGYDSGIGGILGDQMG